MSNNYNVIHNGKKVNMELKDVFDKYKYQTLQTITPLTLYNIEFLEKYIFEYNNVTMLVDLNSNNNMSSVDNHVLAHNTAIRIRLLKTNKIQEIYNELSNRTKINISNSNIMLKTPLFTKLESNYFLMNNNENPNENRVVLFPSNTEANQLNKLPSQQPTQTNVYKTIFIFDNSDIYNELLNDFNNLMNISVPYLPHKIITLNKTRVGQLSKLDGEPNDKITLTNTEINSISEMGIDEVMVQIEDALNKDNNDPGKIDKKEFLKLREISEESDIKINNSIDELIDTMDSYKFMRELISHATVNPKLLDKATRKKKIKNYLSSIVENNKESGSVIDNRSKLYNDYSYRSSDSGTTGIYMRNITTGDSEYVGEYIKLQDLKNSLNVINNIVESYIKYSKSGNVEYGKIIFEAILYTFMSPVMSEYRRIVHGIDAEMAVNIPMIMLIGGAGESGKTTLIKMLKRLVSVDNNIEVPELSYIGKSIGGNRWKSDTIKAIQDSMFSENVYPIMIDEIPDWMFEKRHVDNWIKDVSNGMFDIQNQTPVFIGTTNTENVTVNHANLRRLLYLPITKTFKTSDIDQVKERDLFKDLIITNLDNKLFLDFIKRISKMLEVMDSKSFIKISRKTADIDFLYLARKIFVWYYGQAQMELPKYFPTDTVDVGQEQNRSMWRNAFLDEPTLFTERKHGGIDVFIVKIAKFDEINDGYGVPQSIIYKNALDPRVIVNDSSGGQHVMIDKSAFFDWIEFDHLNEIEIE